MDILQIPIVVLKEIMLFLDHNSTHRFSEVCKYTAFTVLNRNVCCFVCNRKYVCVLNGFVYWKKYWRKIIRVNCYSSNSVSYSERIVFYGRTDDQFTSEVLVCQSCIHNCDKCKLVYAERPYVDPYGKRICKKCRKKQK